MLVSIVLQLQSASNVELPAHLGRSSYTAALRLLDSATPGLGDRIHEWQGIKPLTCSGLFGSGPTRALRYRRGKALIRAGETYWVRYTGLTEEVSASLIKACFGERPATWEAARHPFDIVGAVCDGGLHEWSGNTTYQDLATAHLLGTQQERLQKVAMEFHSPTAFKSHELQVPLPLPRLVYGSLLERWNTFSPVELRAEMRAFGEYGVEISRFDLKSVLLEQKRGATRVGSVGSATYTAMDGDQYWLGLFQLLTDFALYSGVGVQTTSGMGQVRRCHKR